MVHYGNCVNQMHENMTSYDEKWTLISCTDTDTQQMHNIFVHLKPFKKNTFFPLL